MCGWKKEQRAELQGCSCPCACLPHGPSLPTLSPPPPPLPHPSLLPRPLSQGLPNAFIKASLGSLRYSTRVAPRSSSPQWMETFRAAVTTWDAPSLLVLRVLSKGCFTTKDLG